MKLFDIYPRLGTRDVQWDTPEEWFNFLEYCVLIGKWKLPQRHETFDMILSHQFPIIRCMTRELVPYLEEYYEIIKDKL